MTALIYIAAALAEIGGCFAFWAWLRMGNSPLWLAPGIALQRDNQDASAATIRMRIARGCGGAGRSPEPT